MNEIGPMRSDVGEIVRVVDEGLAYVLLQSNESIFTVVAADLRAGSDGAPGGKSLVRNAVADVVWDEATGTVSSVAMREGPVRRGSGVADERLAKAAEATRQQDGLQRELSPEDVPARTVRPGRALSNKTRAFGKLLSCDNLLPGDLLLSRDVEPDRISRLIQEVQSAGGYVDRDAQWTHAAMYLGDGANVVEATFTSVWAGGSVKISRIDDYCDGKYALRLRRPVRLESDRERWSVCVRALARLNKSYNFLDAARLWFRVVVRGRQLDDDPRRFAVSEATICSTLYADAYNEATRRSLGELGGICVPAWLSGSEEFEDLDCSWVGLT